MKSEILDTRYQINSSRATAIAPSDANDLDPIGGLVYVGVTGDVAVQTKDGDAVTFIGVPAGNVLPLKVSRVLATGTTATSLIHLY